MKKIPKDLHFSSSKCDKFEERIITGIEKSDTSVFNRQSSAFYSHELYFEIFIAE
jgi:hypothetical protein